MSLEYFIKKYNRTMSQYEIDEIEDNTIKSIKIKYWKMKYEAFKDEHNISDKDLNDYYNYLMDKEKKELESLYNSTYKQV